METARIDWLDANGRDRASGGVVIVNAFCNFLRELVYPGNVIVRTYASDPGRSSYESWVTMERADQPGVLCATGGATTVWVDFPSKKPAPLPAWLRAAIEG
jgi:acyl-CoA thioester hydrolase